MYRCVIPSPTHWDILCVVTLLSHEQPLDRPLIHHGPPSMPCAFPLLRQCLNIDEHVVVMHHMIEFHDRMHHYFMVSNSGVGQLTVLPIFVRIKR